MDAGKIYFRVPQKAKPYFERIMSSRQKFEYEFDYYYLCIIIGVLSGNLGAEKDVSPAYLTDSYPGPYKARRGILAGLLIEAEMRRLNILASDRERVQQLILSLTANNDTFLSEEGAKLLNQYAAGGLDVIQDAIITPDNLSTFLVQYYQLIHRMEKPEQSWQANKVNETKTN